MLLIAWVVLHFSGCTPSLVEAAAYAAGKTTGQPRQAPTGNEIIGVWTSSEGPSKRTNGAGALLFRPDGTGLERSIDPATGFVREWTFTWRYEGQGVWAGKHLTSYDIKPTPSGAMRTADARRFTVRLQGGRLVMGAGGVTSGGSRTFVREN